MNTWNNSSMFLFPTRGSVDFWKMQQFLGNLGGASLL